MTETGTKLIVGLANPGENYKKTRHNAGAWYVEKLAQQYQATLKKNSKWFSYIEKLSLPSGELLLAIPTTFMNLSGHAVSAIANFYRLQPSQIMIAHDELDLPPGSARFKLAGGTGGHNGLKSVQSCLSNQSTFNRLRIGIGHPGDRQQVNQYVLSCPTNRDQHLIDSAIAAAVVETEVLLTNGLQAAMNRLHAFKAVNQ